MITTETPDTTKKHIFVTGGVGFIGSHTVLALLNEGCAVTIVDNLDNAHMECYSRMKELAGKEQSKHMTFIKADLRDEAALDAALGSGSFDAVIHFAGRKAVGESVAEPMLYYTHNLVGTVNLIQAMRKHGVRNLVFSSSCTVYGEPAYTPIDEAHPRKAVSPYGRTKLVIEDMLGDVARAEDGWRIVMLRYFNPVGAHPSGRIGESPVGVPNNLMPFVEQVALGTRRALNVYGTDYPTRDGTCIRDYIHVCDLAEGHVAALRRLGSLPNRTCAAYNLGTGTGKTVLEMVRSFEDASGKKVALNLTGRRPGDAVAVWADTETAARELGWTAQRTVADMCRDQWRWAFQNPAGFA